MADTFPNRLDLIKWRLTDKKAWRGARKLALALIGFALGPVGFLLIGFTMQLWRVRKPLLSFRGRTTCKLFLAVFAIYLVYGGFDYGLIQRATASAAVWLHWSLVAVLAGAPVAVSALAIGTKRLHDRNKSGWWLLLFYGVPAVLAGASSLVSVPKALTCWLRRSF
jgi:uncharacterized membrane protein YhaH (DUF805 family)